MNINSEQYWVTRNKRTPAMPGRSTKTHFKNNSLFWKNWGHKTLVLFSCSGLKNSEFSSHNPIPGLCFNKLQFISNVKWEVSVGKFLNNFPALKFMISKWTSKPQMYVRRNFISLCLMFHWNISLKHWSFLGVACTASGNLKRDFLSIWVKGFPSVQWNVCLT